MADRGLFWSPVPDWSRAEIRYPDLHVAVQSVQIAWLVSGDLPKFLSRRRALACVGPREACDKGTYALRLAPDRLLFVSRDGERDGTLIDGEQFGWSDDGIAITDISDGFVLFDITGPAASDLMALGASYDFAGMPAGPAESASMLFADLRASIARILPGWRVHIERPHAAAMWHWIQHAAQEWAKPTGQEQRRALLQPIGTE